MPRQPTAKMPRHLCRRLPRHLCRRLPSAKMPRRFGWLLSMVPYEAANFSSQLRVALADPEMQDLLRASAQARRVLAPLCRMLAIEAEVLVPGEPLIVLKRRLPPPLVGGNTLRIKVFLLLFLQKKKVLLC